MRKIIISIVGGVVVIIVAMGISNAMANSKKAPETSNLTESKTVYVKQVKNETIPLSITTSGSLLAKKRMAVYAEVQGVFVPSSKLFKAGERYAKGETLVNINSEEFRANVIAQRSAFKSLITSILPDIQFDYPVSFDMWKAYLGSINIEQQLPVLPKAKSEKEQSYLTGKNVTVTYYNIKNLETRLKKYIIRAPYSGVLVDANITPGSLVSPGQKLGEFIKPDLFELELNVNANLQDFLTKGKTVELSDIEHTTKYTGTVTRINEKIDRASQTVKIFVEVHAKDLKEGEYLEASIGAKSAENAIEIPRSLLVNNDNIYIVKDSSLHLHPVNIYYSGLNSVVIKGLPNDLSYVSKPVTGGFEGMKVKPVKAN